MTKQEAFSEINKIQNEYVKDLLGLINSSDYEMMKTIDFTSATGTGKTKMMSKLINLLPDCYFIVTTLSKGQLHLQVREELEKDCLQDNYFVYGSADYKINSKLDAEDIIDKIPENTKCIWLRDEGHIKTNRYDELLQNVCYKVINFSATNPHSDIQCNFTQTMMLRTVNQTSGTPADAIKRLIEIKKAHKKIKGYNPCAIFRCITGNDKLHKEIVALCKKNNLKYIDINDDPYVMAELCEDDNENDVIINKFKIVEGIDIRRAHVLYMDNQPENNATTIQAIGRCRRNALLYRDDIDILAPENEKLLKETRECYVYYNVKSMRIDADQDGELQYAFCNYISCEALKAGTTIEVTDGQLENGLYVLELEGQTGRFNIRTDESTGFNIVDPITDFYAAKEDYFGNVENFIYLYNDRKVHIKNLKYFPMTLGEDIVKDPYMFSLNRREKKHLPYYDLYKTFDYHDLYYSLCKAACKKYTESFTFKVTNDLETKTKLINVYTRYIKIFTRKHIKELLVAKLDINYIIDYLNVPKESINDSIKVNLATVRLFIDFALLFFIREKMSIDYFQSQKKDEFFICAGGEKYIKARFLDLEKLLRLLYVPEGMVDEYTEIIFSSLNRLDECVRTHTIKDTHYDYEDFVKPLTDDEKYQMDTGKLSRYYGGYYKNQLLTPNVIEKFIIQKDYVWTINDRHSAMIGTDSMKQIRLESGTRWIEARAITSKVGSYTKLDRYISKQYFKELEYARTLYFSGKNDFSFDKKCNSIIGYCVEYYSKFLVYGNRYLYPHIDRALGEANRRKPTREVIIRACMLKYKAMMALCFGDETAKLIQGIKIKQLITENYKDFVSLVVKLGKRTAEYVKANIYPNREPVNNVNPNLSVRHISGLADYITSDTILDVKVRNNIDEKCVKQVLAYHYLSTKRTDLNIKRVIVYDATSDRALVIPIDPSNQIRSNGE